MECSFRAELNEHRYYVLNPTGTLNIRGHPIVRLYVVQPYQYSRTTTLWENSGPRPGGCGKNIYRHVPIMHALWETIFPHGVYSSFRH